MIETYLNVLDLTFFEVQEAFRGLADENVWKRPAEGLLSIGEISGHVAYWMAIKLAGDPPETEGAKCRISSLLIDPRFRYYTTNIETSPSDEQLAMTAEQVGSELVRVFHEAVADLKTQDPTPESIPSGWPSYATYGETLKYQIFHVSYHTGQIYTVRHLLGEQPPDN